VRSGCDRGTIEISDRRKDKKKKLEKGEREKGRGVERASNKDTV